MILVEEDIFVFDGRSCERYSTAEWPATTIEAHVGVNSDRWDLLLHLLPRWVSRVDNVNSYGDVNGYGYGRRD